MNARRVARSTTSTLYRQKRAAGASAACHGGARLGAPCDRARLGDGGALGTRGARIRGRHHARKGAGTASILR
jgi:hypothetical protein